MAKTARCPLSLPRLEECSRKFRGPGAFPGRAGSLRPVDEKGGETGQLSRLHGPGEALGWESGHLGSGNASGRSAQHWGRSREAVPRPSKGRLEPGGLISELGRALHGGKAGDTASISRLYQLRRWAARPQEGWCSGLRRLWSGAWWWSYPSVGAGRVVLPFRGQCGVCGSWGPRAEGWTGEW